MVPLRIRTPAFFHDRSCLRGPRGWCEMLQAGVGAASSRQREHHQPHADLQPAAGSRGPEPKAEGRACAQRGGGSRGRREVVSAEARTRGPGGAQPRSLSPSPSTRSSPPSRGRHVFRGPARRQLARRAQPAGEEGGGSRPTGRRSREETMSGKYRQISTTERVIKGAQRAAGNGPRRATARELEERGWRQRREALQGAGRTRRPSAGVLGNCWTGT